jgi:hypothetical protein
MAEQMTLAQRLREILCAEEGDALDDDVRAALWKLIDDHYRDNRQWGMVLDMMVKAGVLGRPISTDKDGGHNQE